MTWLGRVVGWVDIRADAAINRRTTELWGTPPPSEHRCVHRTSGAGHNCRCDLARDHARREECTL